MQIRVALDDDARAIASLLGELGYPTHVEAVPPRLARVRESGDLVLVAEIDGVVVGLVHGHERRRLERDEGSYRLSAIVVAEHSRRLGVGAALVAAVETEARGRGCGQLELTTSIDRSGAHDFYRALGFEQWSTRYAKRLD
jgi:GNAT superfamily N-acetyltransferase